MRAATAIFVAAAMIVCRSAPAVAQVSRPADEYLVGVYYFAGWWPQLPNKYTVDAKDWRPLWPDRRALLGEFNDQPTMDREIAAASTFGVDFFQFLWYFQGNARSETHQEQLNAGIARFLDSPRSAKLSFTVEYCNHPPFGIASDEQWTDACRQWAAWMKHPGYLRVDGRAVFKIHGFHFFNKECGSPRQAARRVAVLRQIARDEGAGELLVSAGIGPTESPDKNSAAPFNFFTTYMDVPQLPQRDKLYPYADLLSPSQAACRLLPRAKPYVPYLPAGWDPRPWRDPRPSFEMPTRGQWVEALKGMKHALDASENLGVPRGNGSRQKMLMIYAWNEFGEGGIVAPTRGRQYQMLEGIREVFGP